MVDLWRRMQERLSAIPGVAAVGASNQAVLNGGLVGMGVPSVAIIIRRRAAEADDAESADGRS